MSAEGRGRVHELKIWPGWFGPVVDGSKLFEVRKNDRGFEVGDVLWLREWSEEHGYSGRDVRVRVTFLLDDDAPGVVDGYCVMAVAFQPDEPRRVRSVVDECSNCAAALHDLCSPPCECGCGPSVQLMRGWRERNRRFFQ